VSNHLTWYVARASGIVTWGLLVASMVWGLLYATKVFGRKVSAWWLLGVHRWLGVLAIVFTGIHVVALLTDSYVQFTVRDVLVPFIGPWKPLATGLGIISMYLLLAIELTSLAKAKLPYHVWRWIHLASYALFALATIHALASGTDLGTVLNDGLLVALGAVAVAVAVVMIDRRMGDDPRRPVPAPRRSPMR
jgi:predicted ferric reductase